MQTNGAKNLRFPQIFVQYLHLAVRKILLAFTISCGLESGDETTGVVHPAAERAGGGVGPVDEMGEVLEGDLELGVHGIE